jgi:hypothetical protein
MTTSNEVRDGIDQIREILVGAIQRELERRVARAEAHLTMKANELQQEARRRTEVVETHLKKETDALSARVQADGVETKDALRALGREQREAFSAMEQRIAKLEDALGQAQHSLRQELLDQAKSFLDELHQMRAELSETLERELGSLEELGEEPPYRESREADARTS